MKKRLPLTLALTIPVAGAIALVVASKRARAPEAPLGQSVASASSPAPAPRSAVVRASSPVATRARFRATPRIGHEEKWRRFRDIFGADLLGDFTADGRLASVRAGASPGRPAARGFDSSDPQKAIARAREILEAAGELIGVDPAWPLEQPISRGNDISAQVSFRETHDGVPVEPRGSVSVDLGAHGELEGLYSTYVSDVTLGNNSELAGDQALARAEAEGAALSQDSLRTEGGSTVIWISGQSGRYAYEYTVHGHLLVVDGSNGAILSRRDRRQF